MLDIRFSLLDALFSIIWIFIV